MSQFDAMFADCAAPVLMDVFGYTTIVYRSLANQQTSPVGSTELAWCSLGTEVRNIRERDHGLEVYYERHGWVITDTESSEYCGVSEIQMNGKIVDGDREYSIDQVKKRDGGKITDFRCVRVDWIESRNSSLRGR
jgi:hypothetical protein